MKLAHVVVASAALLGMSYGIAQVSHSPAGVSCNPCTAFVMVPDGCGGGIVVAPDPIHLKSNTTITWQVISPGWTIDPKAGINVFNGGGEFAPAKSHKPSPSNTSFALDFTKKSPSPSAYKYDITLSSKAGSCTRDPTIVIH